MNNLSYGFFTYDYWPHHIPIWNMIIADNEKPPIRRWIVLTNLSYSNFIFVYTSYR
jgi:hypothetical protein